MEHNLDDYGFCRRCGRFAPLKYDCNGYGVDPFVFWVLLSIGVMLCISLFADDPYAPPQPPTEQTRGHIVW